MIKIVRTLKNEQGHLVVFVGTQARQSTSNSSGVLGLGGVLGECLDKIISCDFKVSIRLLPSIFVSVKPKDLQLDWVKVSNYKGNLFHINNQSTSFYNWTESIPKGHQGRNSSSANNVDKMTTKSKIEN